MPESNTTIQSARLDLVLMTPAFFAAAISGDQAQAAQLLKTMETDPMVLTLQREFGARLLPETLVVQAPGSMQ